MAFPVTINNQVYYLPNVGDSTINGQSWGLTVDAWFIAISQSTLQLSGGTFPLTAPLSFGNNYGISAITGTFGSLTSNASLSLKQQNSLPAPVAGYAQLAVGSDQNVYAITGNGTFNITNPTPSGSVTSVSLSLPSIFTVTGSPVTSTGTLTATLVPQSQNRVFASPDSASGAPSFRALVGADLPALSSITGALLLTQLDSGGASLGQGMAWNGSQWAPSSAFPTGVQAQNTVFAAPNGISGLPSFRSLVVTDIPSLPASKITNGQLPLNFGGTGSDLSATQGYLVQTVSGQNVSTTATIPLTDLAQAGAVAGNVIAWDGLHNDWVASGLASTSATVRYVGLTVPGIMTVTGSPVTTSGTLAISLNTQSSGTFLAAPNAGGTPSFRTIQTSDLPSLPAGQITGLATSATTDTTNASNISTGTLNASRLPTIPLTSLAQTGASSNQVIAWNGSQWSPANQTGGSGSGWTSGPIAATTGSFTAVTDSGNLTVLGSSSLQSLQVTSFSDTGNANIIGSTTLQSASVTGLTVSGNATVTGNTSLATLTTTGNATIGGNAIITGTASNTGLTVSGNSVVTQSGQFNSLGVANNATVIGMVTASGLALMNTANTPVSRSGQGILYAKSSDSNLYYLPGSGGSYQLTPPSTGGGGGGGGLAGTGAAGQVGVYAGSATINGANTLTFQNTALTVSGNLILQQQTTNPGATSGAGTFVVSGSNGYPYYTNPNGQVNGFVGLQPLQMGIVGSTANAVWSASGSSVTWICPATIAGNKVNKVVVTGITARLLSGSPGISATFSMSLNNGFGTIFGSRALPPASGGVSVGWYATSYTELGNSTFSLMDPTSYTTLTFTSAGTYSATGTWVFDVQGYYL